MRLKTNSPRRNAAPHMISVVASICFSLAASVIARSAREPGVDRPRPAAMDPPSDGSPQEPALSATAAVPWTCRHRESRVSACTRAAAIGGASCLSTSCDGETGATVREYSRHSRAPMFFGCSCTACSAKPCAVTYRPASASRQAVPSSAGALFASRTSARSSCSRAATQLLRRRCTSPSAACAAATSSSIDNARSALAMASCASDAASFPPTLR